MVRNQPAEGLFTINLTGEIENFINQFGKAYLGQLEAFFKMPEISMDNIMYSLKSLLHDRSCMLENNTNLGAITPKTAIIARKSFDVSKTDGDFISAAGWAVAAIGRNNIRSFIVGTYPIEAFVIKNDDEVYDFTTIYPGYVNDTAVSAARYIKASLPVNTEDTTNHVAVVYNDKELDAIRKTKLFSHYFIVPKNMFIEENNVIEEF